MVILAPCPLVDIEKISLETGIVIDTFNPNTQEVEANRSLEVPGQPRLLCLKKQEENSVGMSSIGPS